MNSNTFFNQEGLSIPGAMDNSALPQPIDIGGQQRQGSIQFGQRLPQQHMHSNQVHAGNRSNSININNHQRLRRESIAHSQGVGGISWGSLTIGSWLKDEVMMHNNLNNYTNVHQNQTSMSPPIQSSYLPDLEANYCKDYSCCGQLLPTLHDLLKHYEESHISPTPPTHQPKPIQNFETVSTTDVFINSNNQNLRLQQQQQQQQQQLQMQQQQQQQSSRPNSGFGFTQATGYPSQQQQNLQAQAQFQQNTGIHQQLRNQFSHTNGSSQQQQQHQQQQQPPQQGSQFQFNQLQNAGDFSHLPNQQQLQHQQQNMSNQHSAPFPISLSNDESAMDIDEEADEGYIDDPSRNLYVAQGSEKPFTCPVIGCNKTYKNQNGLKYHRLHGHQNQKLHLNPDGTYSVVDPNDGNGMEQDKPYRCEVCGKRYKNLNGLKYHRGHSTH